MTTQNKVESYFENPEQNPKPTTAEIASYVAAAKQAIREMRPEPRLALSDIYLSGSEGDPLYESPQELDELDYFGVEARGFWSKAWSLAHGHQEELEDNFQEVVLGAVEAVAEDPEITDQGAGYLLQKAYWKASDKRRSQRQTYYRKAHDITVTSIDHEADADSDESYGQGHHESLAAPTVDQDLIIATRQVVAGVTDERRRQICDLLMEGLSQSEVARKLGVSPAAVHYQVKKLREKFAPLVD